MFEIIPHTVNIDFMGARKKAFWFSGILSVVAIVFIAFKGFNLGIDFKGGSSAIIAFEEGQADDHGAIEASIKKLLANELKLPDSTVSVQEFGAGAGDTLDGRNVDRILLYSEVTTLVDANKKKALEETLRAKFPEIRIASSEDAGDTMYLTFAADADITARRDELKAVFAGAGFDTITVTSDFERQLEVEFLRDVELQTQDARLNQGGAEAELSTKTSLTTADLAKRKAEAVVGKSDRAFTVEIEAFQAALANHLKVDFAGKFIAVESAATISPSVGADMFAEAMLAILYSLIGILIYVTLRFDFRYAPGGVVSLAHDAIITMGLVALFDLKFSLPIVAAILTIIGYSINDTIIVYDRVRETFVGQSGKDFLGLLNKAINSTLSRTIWTAGTTLFSCVAIIIFGGATVFEFGVTLLMGIAFGTYSSIFIAVPLVYYLDNMQKKRDADKKDDGPKKNRIGRDDSTAADTKRQNKKAAEAAV